jgi:hypothetical protein
MRKNYYDARIEIGPLYFPARKGCFLEKHLMCSSSIMATPGVPVSQSFGVVDFFGQAAAC